MAEPLTELRFNTKEEVEAFLKDAGKGATSRDLTNVPKSLLVPGNKPKEAPPTDVVHPDEALVKAVSQSIESEGARLGFSPREIENIRMQSGFGTLDLSTHPAFKGYTPEQIEPFKQALIRQPLNSSQLRLLHASVDTKKGIQDPTLRSQLAEFNPTGMKADKELEFLGNLFGKGHVGLYPGPKGISYSFVDLPKRDANGRVLPGEFERVVIDEDKITLADLIADTQPMLREAGAGTLGVMTATGIAALLGPLATLPIRALLQTAGASLGTAIADVARQFMLTGTFGKLDTNEIGEAAFRGALATYPGNVAQSVTSKTLAPFSEGLNPVKTEAAEQIAAIGTQKKPALVEMLEGLGFIRTKGAPITKEALTPGQRTDLSGVKFVEESLTQSLGFSRLGKQQIDADRMITRAIKDTTDKIGAASEFEDLAKLVSRAFLGAETAFRKQGSAMFQNALKPVEDKVISGTMLLKALDTEKSFLKSMILERPQVAQRMIRLFMGAGEDVPILGSTTPEGEALFRLPLVQKYLSGQLVPTPQEAEMLLTLLSQRVREIPVGELAKIDSGLAFLMRDLNKVKDFPAREMSTLSRMRRATQSELEAGFSEFGGDFTAYKTAKTFFLNGAPLYRRGILLNALKQASDPSKLGELSGSDKFANMVLTVQEPDLARKITQVFRESPIPGEYKRFKGTYIQTLVSKFQTSEQVYNAKGLREVLSTVKELQGKGDLFKANGPVVSELIGEPVRKELLRLADTLAKIQEVSPTTVKGPISMPRFLNLGGLAVLFGGSSLGLSPSVSALAGAAILVSPIGLTKLWTTPTGIKLLTDGFVLGAAGKAGADYMGRLSAYLVKEGIDHKYLSKNQTIDVLIKENK